MKIEFDYRFDANGFFDAPERRAALEEAGEIWSELLQDDFDTIPVGAEFTTTNPATGMAETIVLDREIDDLLIFVGSNNLQDGANNSSVNLKYGDYHLEACCCSYCSYHAGETVNLSQPGILEQEANFDTDSLLAQAQVNGTDLQGDIFQRRIAANFRNDGVVTDFEPWAGTINFNGDSSINWNFDLNNTDDFSIDFISVALHEIGHILGIGVAPIFDSLGADGSFRGVNAIATNGGEAIPLEADLSHVAEGFSSNSVLLDPLLNENRNLPSDFDLAILADLGYEIEGFEKQGFVPEIATDAAEEINGSDINDLVNGLAGDDNILGNDGNDSINGGIGNDSIFGGVGSDSLLGDMGIDSLHGGVGSDTLDGGADNDLLVGGEDSDLIIGREGDDELQGNAGEDTLQGGADNDSLFGGEDADFLLGNAGEDRLQGGIGDDSIQGNEDNDTILGQEGNDVLDGGAGDDTLVGEGGSDRFFFALDNGNDTINDFKVGEDVIEIATELGFANVDEVVAAITETGVSANPEGLFSIITLSENNTISIFHDLAFDADSFSLVDESSIDSGILNIVDVSIYNSGFTVQFDELLDVSTLDLTDLSLVSESTEEEVAGSLVWDENSFTLSFISSDEVLESDLYDLTLTSGENAFISSTGGFLDGDSNSIAGGNYISQFSIDRSDRRVLTLDNFNTTIGEETAFDITLDNGENVTKAEFTFNYDPDTLSISDVIIDSELPSDWTVTAEDLNTPGMATITVEGTTLLDSGTVDLVQLQGTIPETATYGIDSAIAIKDISLNDGSIDATGDIALQQTSSLGDVDGDGSYSDTDSYLISQFAVGLSDSFTAFPLIDPLVVADINEDGIISALDSFLIAREI